MKKPRLTLLLCLISLTSFSQTWFEAALRGQFGPTFLVNNNISKDHHVSQELSYGNGFGGRLGVCFNDIHEVQVEFMLSQSTQKYHIKLDSSATVIYDKKIVFKTYDIPLLYRHWSNGGYFEVGPQISLVRSAIETNTLAPGVTTVSPKFSENYYSGVIGFGANFVGSGPFSLVLGARLSYGLSDLIGSAGGRSQTQSYPLTDSFYNATYGSYKPTNAVSAMLVIEASFDVGYFVSSHCKNNHVRFLSF